MIKVVNWFMPTSKVKASLNISNQCLACGNTLDINPGSVGRLKHYCDSICRVSFHRGRRPAVTTSDLQVKVENGVLSLLEKKEILAVAIPSLNKNGSRLTNLYIPKILFDKIKDLSIESGLEGKISEIVSLCIYEWLLYRELIVDKDITNIDNSYSEGASNASNEKLKNTDINQEFNWLANLEWLNYIDIS